MANRAATLILKSKAPRVTDGLVEIEPDAGEPAMMLAETIEQISAAMKKLLASGLNRRAIIVLIHDALPAGSYRNPKPGLTEIAKVIDGLESLAERYCR